MAKTSVLVLGFSVTADRESYVEIAQKKLLSGSSFSLSKVGLGGVGLDGLKFILPDIFQDKSPSLVILEIATHFSRGQPQPTRYKEHFEETLSFFQGRNIDLAILDLPRADMMTSPDWMGEMHERYAADLNIPYLRIDLDKTDLRDGTHATPKGHEIYARILQNLLETTQKWEGKKWKGSTHLRGYHLHTIKLAQDDSLFPTTEPFERSGFETELAIITPGQNYRVDIPKDMLLTGMACIKGPLSGDITLSQGKRELTISAYDQWCYYERISFHLFPAMNSGTLTIRQSPDIPEIDLLKGQKNMYTRVGKISHLLLKRKHS